MIEKEVLEKFADIGIYSIYDELKGDFDGNSLYLFSNEDVAKRWFRQILCSSVHPRDRKDLSLYYVGSFNTVSGNILVRKERVVNGGDFEND